ncbi:MAG TPA: DNA starvation/stationary phase protection protein [Planctomycetota bacterium]
MKEHDRESTVKRRLSPEAQERAAATARRPAPSAVPEKHEVADWLNRLLADEFILYTKTLNDHWNVRGMQFSSLHEFFEMLYEASQKIFDDVAERVRTVGGVALGTMREFLQHTRLEEQTVLPPDARGMIANLHADHQAILSTLREGIDAMEERFDDPGTCNFLTDLLEQHEKLAWMLRAHLDKDLA